MALVDGAGIATGFGHASGTAALRTAGTGAAVGTASLQSPGALSAVLAGLATGSTTLSGESHPKGRGVASGSSDLVGSAALAIRSLGAILGRTVMSGQAEVHHVCRPINAIVSPPKTFRYMQPLQRGDLPLFLGNFQGPVVPHRVTFTLFYIRLDGSMMQAGPSGRTPAHGTPGEYYATGRAGEGAQPGRWLVRWEIQQFSCSTPQVKDMCFLVLDAVLAQDPRDTTVRAYKYGWN